MPLADNHYKGNPHIMIAILVGDCRVGKTSYLNSIINKKSTNSTQNVPPTIGV